MHLLSLETKRYILSPLTFLFLSHQGFPWLILRRWMPLDAPAATYFPYPFCTQIRSGRMSYYTAYSIIRPCTGFRSVKLRRLYWNSHPNWIGYTFNISVVSSRLPAHTNTLKKWPSGQTVFVCTTYKWEYVTLSITLYIGFFLPDWFRKCSCACFQSKMMSTPDDFALNCHRR